MVLGEEESVLFREMSLFQGLKSTQIWYLGRKKSVLFREMSLFQGLKSRYLGRKKSVLFRDVSLFQGLKSTQIWYLGRKKSVLFREVYLCPYRGFHCIIQGSSVCAPYVPGWPTILCRTCSLG